MYNNSSNDETYYYEGDENWFLANSYFCKEAFANCIVQPNSTFTIK